ncbi:MAG TPA: diacylglycerol kinase family protein [Methylomirabilota bacterium]|nr:diacylglycerol kinase family protein [Methylomirabilota bacterium]
MASDAVLISNPISGRLRERTQSVARMLDALRARGVRATLQMTAAPGDAERLAREARTAGVGLIIVHGGDGTVNEVLQALVGSGTLLGVWPGGTSNVVSRELDLPSGVEKLADVLAARRIRRVSVGRAGERYFLLMAGVGLDAVLVQRVNPALKRLAGEGAYWMAGIGQLTDWHPMRFLVEAEGMQYGATFAVVANSAWYGGGLHFAPHANMDDDQLDLCLFDSIKRHQFARYLVAARTGSHLEMDGVTYVRVRRAVAQGGGDQFVQVDGELLGPLPVTFECVPAALSLVVP